MFKVKRKSISMDKHPNWKGGKIESLGYIFIKVNEHPGQIAWNKGIPMSKEAKIKASIAIKKRCLERKIRKLNE